MSRPRVLIVGMGAMGLRHAKAFAPLAHVIPHDPPRGIEGDARDIDAAVIAVPATSLADVAVPLLARGVPCLVEKPVGANLAEASRVLAYPHARAAFVERHNPAWGGCLPRDVRQARLWRLAPPSLRAGDVDVLLDLAIHDLDLLNAWGWDAPGTRARAWGVGRAARLDVVVAELIRADGAVATVTSSRVAGLRRRDAFLDTADGVLHADLLRGRSWQDGTIVTPAPQDALTRQATAFLATLGAERPAETDGLGAWRLLGKVRAALGHAS